MNILIIHTAFIGDIVLSTALIAKIADTYKGANIYFLTTPLGKEILKNNPKLKEIIVYDKKKKDKGFKAFFRLIKEIRKTNIDICFCPHRYMRSSLMVLLSGAKEKIGYDISSLSWVYNKKIKYDKTKHEVEKLLSFIDESQKRYELELYPSQKDKEKINNILEFNKIKATRVLRTARLSGGAVAPHPQKNKKATADCGLPPQTPKSNYNLLEYQKKLIVIAPGSKWFTKKWPEEYFCDLIQRLQKNKNYNLIIVGGKEEKEIDLKLDLEKQNILDLRGETTLLELAELINRADIVVSNDSSPIHITSAFPKTRILGIFGPTIKEFGFFPWSQNSKVFEINNLDCRPCGIHGGNTCPQKHFKCMREIKPKTIKKEIDEYLSYGE